MIKIEENQKSEAQIRLEEKLERDKAKLQEQIRKDHRKIEELKRKAKSLIGEMFAEYLPDYYCFEGSELKEIVDIAMTQETVAIKIAEIRNGSDAGDSGADSKAVIMERKLKDSGTDTPEISETESEEITEEEPYEEADTDEEAYEDEDKDEDSGDEAS
ncbi:MAG: hypothetical protein K5870_00785 [Lachnospiraceae bacterium]|nr:hypothetical protein [Lachnospiraceae bacterium]